MTPLPTLRPMTIGDLLDAAFRLYRNHFITFIGIAALLQVPMLIVQVLVQYVLVGGALADILSFSSSPPRVLPGQNPFDVLPIASLIALYATSIGLGLVQYLVVYNLITGALSRAISKSYMGEPISIFDSYALGWRRFFSLVGASLVPYLASFAVLVPLLGCGVGAIALLAGQQGEPSIWLSILMVLGLLAMAAAFVLGMLAVYVRFLLATQAIVLESAGPLNGLRRSWELTRRSFWRSLALIVMMGIIVYIVSSLPASGISFALQLTSRGIEDLLRNSIIASLLGQIGLILALPLQLCVYTLLYYDLRVRREGYDLELQARQVAIA